VLACAEPGATNSGVARALGVSRPTVITWRTRFAARGLDGLLDEPRPGAPRTITDQQVDAVIATTLEQVPPNATHWSTRLLAARVGMSQTAVSRIWRAFGLAPHRAETFKLSRDPLFVEKVRDVVGLYLAPPDARSCCAWTRRPRCRPASPRRRWHPRAPASSNVAPTTTCATARRTCSRRSTWRAAA
jgi:transposase